MLIEIYGQNANGERCTWCSAAIALCEKHGFDHVYRDMTDSSLLRREFLARSNSAKTVPQIFVGNFHVGGYSDFKSRVADNSIQQLIGGK